MNRLLHESARRLKPYRRSAAVIGCARLILTLICLLASIWAQRELQRAGILPSNALFEPLNRSDLFLVGSLLTALAACTPLRMQTAWQIGRLAGTLDGNDLGFLAQSDSLWLWSRAIGTRLLMQLLIVLSVVPSLLLGTVAKCVWLTIPPEQDSLLQLMTVLHLGFLAFAAILLPIKCFAASTALPFCFLKSPHESAFRILRTAFQDTRGQTAGILLNRILMIPFMILPFTAVRIIPILLASEQLRCVIARRHREPPLRTQFSGFELHAYDATI